ncbi:hypothetical protein ONZ45_g14375 [Pleurotus djamor]|nr:hypothetical protein ONZ45_g14375 [Pleurotus djamor]
MSYPKRQLGRNGPMVSAIGFGAMGMGRWYGQFDDEVSLKTLTYAADRGVTFWDTSDVYGSSEALLGKWFTQTGRRSEIFLATKFGGFDLLNPERAYLPNSRPSYIRKEIENSLKALQTDYIDLYYQHRVDPEVPIEVVIKTLGEFIDNGKIRWIGLSECNVDTLRRARSVPGYGEKVVAAQMEFSPFELSVEKDGFASVAKELGVAVVAYSPLARGMVSGRYRSPDDLDEDDIRRGLPRFSAKNFPKNLKIVEQLKMIGDRCRATPSQIALAWILASHPDFVPIPGTREISRLEENANAAEISLSDEDVKQIRTLVENADVAGSRYPESRIPKGDCIPISEWKGEN